MLIAGNRRRGPGLVRSPLLLVALCLPPGLTASGLEVTSAWGGRFVPREPTEVRVEFASPYGGSVLVRIEGGAGIVEKRLTTEAGQRTTASLPAYPGSDGELVVQVVRPNGDAAMQGVQLQPRRGGLDAAIITPDAADDTLAGVIQVDVGDLPLLLSGYGPLTSLTMPRIALAALDEDQIAALGKFVAACGILVIPDAHPTLLDQLRSTAGCAGRFVSATRRPDRPPTLPEDGAIAGSLLPDAGPNARELGLLLLPYPLLLAGLVLLRRSGPWLLLLPPVAVLAYAGALHEATPPAVAATWAETVTGDTHYRSVTVVRSSGGSTPLRLPKEAGLVQPSERPLRLHIDPDGGVVLEAPKPFLSYREYRLDGVGRVPFRLHISRSGKGTRIANAGPEPSPPGWLLWQGAGYPVAAIAPGASQTVPADASAVDPPLPLPIPVGKAPGMLVPLPAASPAAVSSDIHSSGWLWVRSVDVPSS